MALSLPQGSKLVFATHNPGKVKELASLLDGRFEIVSAGDLGLPEPEETEQTFVGNAVLKARAASEACGLIAIADDSGLSVAALGGLPGVVSARWAEREDGRRDFDFAMRRVEREVEQAGGERAAFFTSALAVAWPQGPIVAVEGRVDGRLVFPPRGANGFGYDPIFMMDGLDKTFGEITAAEKDALNHRSIAFEKLKAALF